MPTPRVYALALGVALTALACASIATARLTNHRDPRRPPTNVADRSIRTGKGILTGSIMLVGGDPFANRSRFTGGLVTAVAQTHRAVAHMRVGAGHPFRFTLPPGSYLLTVHPSYGCSAIAVRVQAHQTTRANVPVGCAIY
jgi:hypothetical protein